MPQPNSAIQGIFLGWIIGKSLDETAETRRFIAGLTQDMYTGRTIGGVSSFVSLTGSWAFLVAVTAIWLSEGRRWRLCSLWYWPAHPVP